MPLLVVKRSGDRVPFDRERIVRGVSLAAKGRPLDVHALSALADRIEDSARVRGDEVTSEWIGLTVLAHLRAADEVTALRFASVYKGFTQVADFERELSLIKLDHAGDAGLIG